MAKKPEYPQTCCVPKLFKQLGCIVKTGKIAQLPVYLNCVFTVPVVVGKLEFCHILSSLEKVFALSEANVERVLNYCFFYIILHLKQLSNCLIEQNLKRK